ncbi:hypothetical protein GCK72_000910 [Caenorhabditis remanei]|uniref:RING-type E3 ubiquitin transferase n=1 Tax=Caenorhabditis remanei TaxID=31234 RepID=A0A6A5HRY3_CAERE|nr:hypothetical protein GCK72_000910 [Caenorhabditis remanei]KAF1769097.1 hypothetical protein GCK72_000910 [Caenorhabditis remanei]
MPQYYCHRCTRSFDLDANAPVACTRCQGEFVEEVSTPAMVAAGMPPGFHALQQIAEIIRNGMVQDFTGLIPEGLIPQEQQGEQAVPQQHAEPTAPPQEADLVAPQQRAAQAAPQQQADQGDPPPQLERQAEAPRAAGGDPGARQANVGPTLEDFIHSMFRMEPRPAAAGEDPQPNVTFSFQMPGGVGIQIHAHRAGPQDAAGQVPQFVGNIPDGERVELETAMQDLLAQFQGEGGMMSRGFLEADVKQYLPMKKVTQEQIDNGVQCTTCFDTFKLGEDVGALDCNHIFHRPCIEPWLTTKNSCPVCRQKVSMKSWKRNHQRRAQEAVLEDLD